MTGHLIAWAVAFIVIIALFALLVRREKVTVPEIRRERFTRSPDHQAKVIALVDWLQDPKIVRTILEARVATGDGLQKTLEDIEGMPEAKVNATVACILREKTVRRVIASYNERERGLPRAAVAKALLEWADPAFLETTH